MHLYLTKQARLAELVGIPTPLLCGRVEKDPTGPDHERGVETVGGLMVIPEPNDCKQCVRALEAFLAD